MPLPVLTRRVVAGVPPRAVGALALALALTTCTDDPSGPGGSRRAHLALHPSFATAIDLAAFGITIDSLRVIVIRPVADTLADATYPFPADSSALSLPVTVNLIQPVETLSVFLEFRGGGLALFSGSRLVEVQSGGPGTNAPDTVPVSYSGPGGGVDSLEVTPDDSTISFSDSVRFRVAAFQAGAPVTQFYVAWTTSDTLAARANAIGLVRAPALRRTLYVIARTPTAVRDSTLVTFQPVATTLAMVSGNAQSGTRNALLPQPLRVRVTASDGLGVRGITVTFAAVTGGGSVAAATVVTDTGGYAQTTATLGGVLGANAFQASAPGLTPVSFAATAVSGTATQLAFTVQPAAATAGLALTPAVEVTARDAQGFTATSFAGTVTIALGANPGGATVTGNSAVAVNGVATFGNLILDKAATGYTLVASSGSLTPATSAPFGVVAGAVSTARSLVTASTATLASGSVATLTLVAKDAFGNDLTTGGLAVAFTQSGGGGVSTGLIGTTTDNGNGTYTATFTGALAGTATTIGATINGSAVTSTLPTIAVIPGTVSTAQSLVTVSSGSVASGAPVTVTLQARDAAGNNLSSGGATVVFSATGGTSTGTIGATTDNGDGTYTAAFTGVLAGTATTIGATINGSAVTSTLPTVTVLPGAASLATSVVTVSSGTVASGAQATLTLVAKDSAGNTLTAGGLTVDFTASGGGGVSTGTITPSPATDNGNGTYTATFTGAIAGTPTTIGATIGGSAVTSTLPTITVVPSNAVTAQSIVTVSADTAVSGAVVTLTMQARDSAGNNLTTGGLTVAFTASGGGGVSTGTIAPSPATDNGDGTYTATFTAVLAGTPTTIGATINGSPVTSTLPTITVLAGAASAATSLVSVSSATLASSTAATLTLQAKDAAGNNLTSGGATVAFSATGGTSTGTIGATTDNGDGTYTATFTGVLAGTATTIGATLNGAAVTSPLPTITVVPGAISAATSLITVSDSVVLVSVSASLSLQARDAAGNAIATGGATVRFTATGGTSTGTISPDPATDNGDGTYSATFTGVTAGSPVSIGATINGAPVTSTLPTIRVTLTAHASDITADETWTAAASPHQVSGYLRVRNGATLTIEPGAEVRFDAGAGLQLGDTTLGETGGLVLAGTAAAQITLTANSGAPTPGFWRGLEVQRNLAGTMWKNVLIEWGGGPRPNPFNEGCILTVNGSGAALALDSVRIRQCVHAGIHHFGGTLQVLRSTIDSVTGSAIHADFAAALEVDSTVFRGSVNDGLQLNTPTVRLVDSEGNQFLGNGGVGITMFGDQLPGLLRQATIAGNGQDSIEVFGGRADTSAGVFTIFTQPAPYRVAGLIQVGRSGAGGTTVTLDSGLAMVFTNLGGLQVGDTSGTQRGQIRSRGTATSPVFLRNVPGGPAWRGVGLGLSVAPDSLKHITLLRGGGSGGVFGTVGGIATAANLTILKRSGSTPFIIDSVRADSSAGDGIHIVQAPASVTPRSKVVRSSFTGNTLSGLLVLTSGTSPSVEDSLNSFVQNLLRPIVLSGHALAGHTLQAAFDTTGPGLDDILVAGSQTYSGNMQPPAQLPYVIADSTLLVQGGGGMFTLEPNLVLKFGRAAGLVIGDSATGPSGNIVSLGTNRTDAPRLTSRQASPAPGDWYGVEIGRLSGNARLANVRIEYAGDSIPGRNPHRIGLWVRNAQPSSLIVDSVVFAYNGKIGADSNATGFLATGAGTGVDVVRSVADTNAGYGMVLNHRDVSFVADTARGNTIGFGVFTDDVDTRLLPTDSLAGNVATGNVTYPLELDIRALPVLRGNAFTGNGRDTLLLRGGTFSANDTLPKFAGLPWRVAESFNIDSGGALTLAPGDTLVFDDSTGIVVGFFGGLDGGLRAVSSSLEPILLTANPGGANRWFGIQFGNVTANGFTMLQNVVVEKAGRFEPCFRDCIPAAVSGLSVLGTWSATVPLDSVVVRRMIGPAVDLQNVGSGPMVTITNSQFYDNPFSPMIRGPIGQGLAGQLSVQASDLYHYRGDAVSGLYGAQLSPADSVNATNNWWGDVAGPTLSFAFSDSLGRASLGGYAVRSLGATTTPFFPSAVGSAVALTATTDTILPAGDSVLTVLDFSFDPASADSVRVRALDAFGRGVSGLGVTWVPSGGVANPGGGTSDVGGRVATQWTAGSVADSLTLDALGGVGAVRFHAVAAPGATDPGSVNWLLDPATVADSLHTAGTADTLFASSSNHASVLITGARDFHGNVTHPSSGYFFDEGPCFSFACRYPASDSVRGDTVYFQPPAVGTYVIKGLYDGGANGTGTAGIVIAPNLAGVRIDRDPFVAGIQDSAPLLFNSLCPAAGPCSFYSERMVAAFPVDSGGAPLANASARFQWSTVNVGVITGDSIFGGAVGDTLWVQARTNGSDTLIVTDTVPTSLTYLKVDSVPILVDQLGSYVQFTPDTMSLLIGQSGTFQAAVIDIGGQPMVGEAVHFRVDSFAPGTLTITDTAVFNQVTVRLDSTPFGTTFLEGFWGRPLADTVYGYFPGDTLVGVASVMNPVPFSVTVAFNPTTVAIDPTTDRAYVASGNPSILSVIDGATQSKIAELTVNYNPNGVAVNTKTGKVYVSETFGGPVYVIATATNTILDSIAIAGLQFEGLVALDTGANRVFVPGFTAFTSLGFLYIIDGATDAVVDSVALPAEGKGVAFNAADGLVWVTLPSLDSVAVVDPVARSVVAMIAVGDGPYGIAINGTTQKAYVTNANDGSLSIIDAVTRTAQGTLGIGVATPQGLSVDPLRNELFISDLGNNVIVVVDGQANAVLGYLDVGGVSADAAVNPVSRKVFVSLFSNAAVRVLQFIP